jgi:hypothetical protein
MFETLILVIQIQRSEKTVLDTKVILFLLINYLACYCQHIQKDRHRSGSTSL